MIVGEQKPFEEIWDMVKGFKRVLVYGCNTCVAICHAGGNKEAEILASMIRIKAAEEGVPMEVKHAGIERHCEPEFFEPLMEEVKTYDLVLSTACGVGVNFLSERIGNIPVYPGINTEFYRGSASGRRLYRAVRRMRQLHSSPYRRNLSCCPLLKIAYERAMRRDQ